MQMTDKQRAADATWFTTELDKTIRAQILAATVLLKTATFTGSGLVLAGDGAGDAYIFTAKHNLFLGKSVKTSPPRKDPSTYVDAFTAAVKIYRGATKLGDAPKIAADFISTPNNGGNSNMFLADQTNAWASDIMMLKAHDAGLVGVAMFRTKGQLKANYSNSAAKYAGTSNPGSVLRRDSHENTFFQLGYGYSDEAASITDPTIGKLQVRTTEPKNQSVAAEMFDWEAAQGIEQPYTALVSLDADKNSSTMPGDSGGPLFVVQAPAKGAPLLYYLGTTLGANQTTEKKASAKAITSNTTAYVNSLYEQVFKKALGI